MLPENFEQVESFWTSYPILYVHTALVSLCYVQVVRTQFEPVYDERRENKFDMKGRLNGLGTNQLDWSCTLTNALQAHYFLLNLVNQH